MTLDEKEALLELADSPTWGVLMRELEAHIKLQEAEVLHYNLSEGPEGLVLKKARVEGARRLLSDLSGRIKTLKAPSKGPKRVMP